ncbi:hypothetical protein ACFC0M_01970 [Streptomyces sp. NPDC056149]|uniref:hypothetical protein n=1 Tax=unclassified Streptomyces TaxID=2593676 RepID=UPI002381883E|nr:hypothetical protein [Streptomyces sp. WZ-12]
MRNKHRLVGAGLAAFLMAGLGACGTGGGGQSVLPHRDPVTGLRAGVRHVTRQTALATRPHQVTTCTPGTRRVKHTKRSGKSKKTWYSTEHYQDCHQTVRGTERYRREIRPERWCVRLDDVNGDRRKNGVWFAVDSDTYHRAVNAKDHARLRFTPTDSGSATGCR